MAMQKLVTKDGKHTCTVMHNGHTMCIDQVVVSTMPAHEPAFEVSDNRVVDPLTGEIYFDARRSYVVYWALEMVEEAMQALPKTD